MTDTQFEMLATQVWIFMFGVSIGAMLVDFKFFWWLPLFIILVLVAYRIWAYFMFRNESDEQI
jgi:membrane protein implicated in regulation of membrane protease activity